METNSGFKNAESAFHYAKRTLHVFSHRLEPLRPADFVAQVGVLEGRDGGGPVVVPVVHHDPHPSVLHPYHSVPTQFEKLKTMVLECVSALYVFDELVKKNNSLVVPRSGMPSGRSKYSPAMIDGHVVSSSGMLRLTTLVNSPQPPSTHLVHDGRCVAGPGSSRHAGHLKLAEVRLQLFAGRRCENVRFEQRCAAQLDELVKKHAMDLLRNGCAFLAVVECESTPEVSERSKEKQLQRGLLLALSASARPPGKPIIGVGVLHQLEEALVRDAKSPAELCLETFVARLRTGDVQLVPHRFCGRDLLQRPILGPSSEDDAL